MKSKEIRDKLKECRLSIKEERRQFAQKKILKLLLGKLKPYKRILSYSSKGSELCTSSLNNQLTQEKKLLLPKVEGDGLGVYYIDSLETGLTLNTHFDVLEPNNTCARIAYSDIDCVIVPALGFDEHNHRVGYGLGFYDKILAQLTCPSIGIAFLEQKLTGAIVVDAHDQTVGEVIYV